MKKTVSLFLILCLLTLSLPLAAGIAVGEQLDAPTVVVDQVHQNDGQVRYRISFPKPAKWDDTIDIGTSVWDSNGQQAAFSSVGYVTPGEIHDDGISAARESISNGDNGFQPGTYTLKVQYGYYLNGQPISSETASVQFTVAPEAVASAGESPDAPVLTVYAISSGAESVRFHLDFTKPADSGNCLFYGFHVYDSNGNPATFSESFRIPMTCVEGNHVSCDGSAESLNDDGFTPGDYSMQVKYFFLKDDDYVYSKAASVNFTVSEEGVGDDRPAAPTVTMDPVSSGDISLTYYVSFPKPKSWDNVIQVTHACKHSDGSTAGYSDSFVILDSDIHGNQISSSYDVEPLDGPFEPGDYFLQIQYYYTSKGADIYSDYAIVNFTVADSGFGKIDLGRAIIEVKDQTWTGKAIKPKLTVTNLGKKLKEGKDFSVSFKNNKAVGKATVTVTGIGEYTGTKTGSFRILPKLVALSSLEAGTKSLKVHWQKGSGITGYEIQYSLKKDFKGAKTVTVSKAGKTKTEITGLKKGKTYYVRIRTYKKVDGKKYASAWSKAKHKTVK